jgi:hypothetical protein
MKSKGIFFWCLGFCTADHWRISSDHQHLLNAYFHDYEHLTPRQKH